MHCGIQATMDIQRSRCAHARETEREGEGEMCNGYVSERRLSSMIFGSQYSITVCHLASSGLRNRVTKIV